jgi:endonuclease/exonuclease/phosphatase family metal-dependent hydrolase
MQIRNVKYMSYFKNLLGLILVLTMFFTCTSRVNSNDDENNPIVNPIGQNEDFELATWNIEWFPKNGQNTINTITQIIRDLDVDMIGVQEIADIQSFNTLLDSLPEWRGVLSSDTYSSGSYQKTGLLYKSSFISISSVKNIFEDESYPFPRPPLMAFVEIRDINEIVYNFNIIVLHLKAFSGTENESRRKKAIEKLENFVSSEISNGADPDFIILGDWNDRLTDSDDHNVFLPFLDYPDDYQFISSSYTNGIDHILITQDSFNEYGAGSTSIPDLDIQLSNYESVVSDHLPVIATFKGFKIQIE